jgi:kinesin family protein C1
MIPRAVEQVFRGTEQMKTKGWEYKMEGQFLEIVGLRHWPCPQRIF